jgi:hypothetical protein
MTDSSDAKGPVQQGIQVPGGIVIRADCVVLASPEEYDRGPRGKVDQQVVQRAAVELAYPVWYMRPDDLAGVTVSTDVADARPIGGLRAGSNPDAGTVLEAVGRLKNPSTH